MWDKNVPVRAGTKAVCVKSDRQMQALEKNVSKMIAHWTLRLGLSAWKITYRFDADKTERTPVGDTGYQQCTGIRVVADWPYMNAMLIAYGQDLISLPLVEIEDLVIHDLGHILVSELVQAKNADDCQLHEERTVTSLQRIIRGQIGPECVAIKVKTKGGGTR